MSETFQSTFGRQIFTNVSASASSSGGDRFDMLDATQLYHQDHDYQAPETLLLSGQESSYAYGHPFAYAPHSGQPSLPSKCTLFTLFFLCFMSFYIMYQVSVPFTASPTCLWNALSFLWVADSAWRHFRGKHAMSRDHDTLRDIHQLEQVLMQGIKDANSLKWPLSCRNAGVIAACSVVHTFCDDTITDVLLRPA